MRPNRRSVRGTPSRNRAQWAIVLLIAIGCAPPTGDVPATSDTATTFDTRPCPSMDLGVGRPIANSSGSPAPVMLELPDQPGGPRPVVNFGLYELIAGPPVELRERDGDVVAREGEEARFFGALSSDGSVTLCEVLPAEP